MKISPERLQRLILEELDLLLELDYEQVQSRTKGKKFRKAFPNDAEMVSYFLMDLLPESISDNQKAEALNWLISWAIKDKLARPEKWAKRLGYLDSFNIDGPLGPNGWLLDTNIAVFYEIKDANLDRFLEINSISKFKSPEQLRTVVLRAARKWEDYKEEQAQVSTKVDPEESKVYEDKHWAVYTPTTQGAAVKLGCNTNWCTASRGQRNEYSNYHKPDDPLIIFIPKKELDDNEKYQFHYGKQEFQDHRRETMVNPFLMDAEDFDNIRGGREGSLGRLQFEEYMKENAMFYFLNSLVARTIDILPPSVISKARSLEFQGVQEWLEENRGPDGRQIEKTAQQPEPDGQQSLFERYSSQFIQQIILEELQLLQELNLADVRKRLQGNKWIKTFAPEGFKKIRDAERGVFPSVPVEGDLKALTHEDLKESIVLKTTLSMGRQEFETKRAMGQIPPAAIKKWYEINGHENHKQMENKKRQITKSLIEKLIKEELQRNL